MIVHGGPGPSHDYFLPYLLPLTRKKRLIFIDERGLGRSGSYRMLTVRWCGTKNLPLGFEFVLGEVKSILTAYQLTTAIGDQYYCDIISQHLQKLGIEYKVFNFGAQTRAALFSNMKHLLAQRRIELLDDPELLRQLGNLRQEKTERGLIDVRPSPGVNDDLAVAVALAASELCRQVT
jgi:hypothetical protein